LIGHFEGWTRCMTCNPAWSSSHKHLHTMVMGQDFWSLLFFSLFCSALVVSLKAGFQPIIPTSLQQYGFCHFRSSPHQDNQSASHDILVFKFHFSTDSAPGHNNYVQYPHKWVLSNSKCWCMSSYCCKREK